MHKRRKSKDDGTDMLSDDQGAPALFISTSLTPQLEGAHNQRARVRSTPSRPELTSFPLSHPDHSFEVLPPVNAGANDLHHTIRPSPSHSRTRSISESSTLPTLSSSISSGTIQSNLTPTQNPPLALSPTQQRRHSRIHSRNLSIYFPRPGQSSVPSISEDGFQDIEYSGGVNGEPTSRTLSPHSALRSAPPMKTRFGEGFKFGGKPAPETSVTPLNATRRRGHHHKHSVSHTLFPFLEPPQPETPSIADPESPFSVLTPVSPPNLNASQLRIPVDHLHISKAAMVFGVLEFLLGGFLWVTGQEVGSLACTGLGYWIVFDSFGVWLARVLPQYLRLPRFKASARPYGNARLETVSLFTQSIYLIFTSVYTCKETVEHLLLSSNEGQDGHHHHHGDELAFISLPKTLILVCMCAIIASSLQFENHASLVDAVGNHLPFSQEYFLNILERSRIPRIKVSARSRWGRLFENPYSTAPLLFSVCLSFIFFLPGHLHRPCDMLLATLETVVTFIVAYPAAVRLGTVLLQTAPHRGLISGRMESFLRIMRELERHPDVKYVPAPHIWQLTASSHGFFEDKQTSLSADRLIVTVELHVSSSLGDEAVLDLTQWTWERLISAIGGTGAGEVTVGVVRD